MSCKEGRGEQKREKIFDEPLTKKKKRKLQKKWMIIYFYYLPSRGMDEAFDGGNTMELEGSI